MSIRTFTIEGALELDNRLDPTTLLRHLADCLLQVNANNVSVEAQRITFKSGPFYLVNRWNVLAPFGFGVLTVDLKAHQLQYSVNFRLMFIMCSAMVVALAIFMIFGKFEWGFFLFLPIAWAWLVFGNLMIGGRRLRAFIERSIVTTPDIVQ